MKFVQTEQSNDGLGVGKVKQNAVAWVDVLAIQTSEQKGLVRLVGLRRFGETRANVSLRANVGVGIGLAKRFSWSKRWLLSSPSYIV
jgi:hypothetical protein